jgi:energy-coupling factor transport system ATP-binding protein
MSLAVTIKDLVYAYPETDQPALNGINGEIPVGTYTVLMGHGGAGKSTLCYAMNALVPRFFRGEYQGQVLIDSKEIARCRVSDMSRLVGLVLQDFEAQLFSTSVELEVAFGPENFGLPKEEIERRIHRYLEFVGLSGMRRREPASLSGGQKQRLAIASVLALEPDLLVMDEPTTDLDPVGRQEVLGVADLLRQEGRTLLIVDHEPEVAEGADQVWLMRAGELVAKGTPAEVLTDLDLLKACGVKPPATIEIFRAMGWPGDPLSVREAKTLIEEYNLAQHCYLNLGKVVEPNSAGRPEPIQAVRNLSYVYPGLEIRALQDVNLEVYPGEFVALLGQNGSGKTTLAKHFNGLLQPTQGQVFLQGKELNSYRRTEVAQLVGYVFQNPDHQLFSNTVREEVGFSLKVAGYDQATINQRVGEALEAVDLSGFEEEIPFTLTKGDRQRVAVASVLATQPQVIILDEPTTGLDYDHQRGMMRMLQRLHQNGHTIIIITHSMWVATEYAQRTIVLQAGRILLDGPTRAVFAEEDKIALAGLHPPALLKLGNWLGTHSLTLEEMVAELRAR